MGRETRNSSFGGSAKKKKNLSFVRFSEFCQSLKPDLCACSVSTHPRLSILFSLSLSLSLSLFLECLYYPSLFGGEGLITTSNLALCLCLLFGHYIQIKRDTQAISFMKNSTIVPQIGCGVPATHGFLVGHDDLPLGNAALYETNECCPPLEQCKRSHYWPLVVLSFATTLPKSGPKLPLSK